MEKNAEHVFYVLECNDGSFYAGYTNNLEKRVRVHNEGKGARYTRAKLPVRCIYKEQFETKREAMQAEYRFKQLSRALKEQYVERGRSTDEVSKKC
ncbi:GIY-YIG nuclease family protein [Sporosarcina sp. HYO08]|uniref:GIY-YIG nuclease family protein n=1 Tax=Sporosarcina sp. HYO08 TaxID=1759557 RepID=UPI000796E4C1|nr:GIY-YIG nuclease family protein [Sporosarcina sp. HYO08]KXH86842.1 endonuclease [Sporosarcina sp. HYO08]